MCLIVYKNPTIVNSILRRKDSSFPFYNFTNLDEQYIIIIITINIIFINMNYIYNNIMIKLNYIYIVDNLLLVHVINEKFVMTSFQIGEI